MPRAPLFWQTRTWRSTCLLPLTWVWQFAGWLRGMFARPHRFPCPVICVGNAIAGGSGKTPVVIDCVTRLQKLGKTVHLVCKGYQGRLSAPTLVDPAIHTAADVGDEALLLATTAPTWIGRNRQAAIACACAAGPDVVIMDDGMQNPHIRATLTLMVVDGGYGFGNRRVIPAGPLRTPLASCLTKADAVILIGEDLHGITDAITPHTPLTATIRLDLPEIARTGPCMAFAGIGRPEKFFTSLRGHGVQLDQTWAFADHAAFADKDLEMILTTARQRSMPVLTTCKDWQRLPAFRQRAGSIHPVPMRLEWTRQDALERLLCAIFDTD